MSDETPPDQLEGAPHPRETQRLFGQDHAESEFLHAFATGRMHHGWLLAGPRGVGKATLAWRIARFLLAQPAEAGADGLFGAPPPPQTLEIDPEHTVARQVRAGSAPGLKSVIRTVNDRGTMRNEIVADDIRALNAFFALSAPDGGRRVVIVDTADRMNTHAANALLKMLEEPPARATLLLVSHQPTRLLPTIRSRCRTLRLAPVGPEDLAAALRQAGIEPPADPQPLAELSGGSVGEAMRLLSLDGLALYAGIVRLLGSLPRLDRAAAVALAESASARGAEERSDLIFALLETALARLARTGATGAPPPEAAAGEADTFRRMAPDPAAARAWAATAAETSERVAHGRAVNLDRASLVLDTVFKLQQTASNIALAAAP